MYLIYIIFRENNSLLEARSLRSWVTWSHGWRRGFPKPKWFLKLIILILALAYVSQITINDYYYLFLIFYSDIFVRSCKPTILPPSLKPKTHITPKFIPKHPPKLRQYTIANDVNTFYYSRPFRKSTAKAENEHNVIINHWYCWLILIL